MSTHFRIARALPRYVAPAGGGYSAAVLALGPYWYSRLGDASGTTMTDASGNGNNGTYGSAVTLGAAGATSDGDKAITLAGASTSESTVPNGSYTNTAAFSVAAFVKFTGTAQQMIFTLSGSSSAYAWLLYVNSGKAAFTVRTGSALGPTATSTINDGAYHLLVGTWDGSTVTLYVDGSSVGTTSLTGTLSWTTSYLLRVGGRGGNYLTGSVDEVAAFNYALTSTQVSVLYAAR